MPAGQALHTQAPAREYCPAGHTAAVALMDPATHTYPALQLPVQAGVPVAGLAPYCPAAHAVHADAPALE